MFVSFFCPRRSRIIFISQISCFCKKSLKSNKSSFLAIGGIFTINSWISIHLFSEISFSSFSSKFSGKTEYFSELFFIFSVIVPIIQGIYFSIILTILSKFNIYMFENENIDYRKSLYRLRKKAVKEDNFVLWSAYQEEKANLQKINFIFSATWGILIFSILGCFGKSGKSILIDMVIILNSVAENNVLLGMVIYFLFFIISFWCFSILQRSLYLREDILPYWEDDKKANS